MPKQVTIKLTIPADLQASLTHLSELYDLDSTNQLTRMVLEAFTKMALADATLELPLMLSQVPANN